MDLMVSYSTQEKEKQVEWYQIENQQSPVCVVNFHFSRRPDGCWSSASTFTLGSSLTYLRGTV